MFHVKNKRNSFITIKFFLVKLAHWPLLIINVLLWEEMDKRGEGRQRKRWGLDLILLSRLQAQDICHTDVFDWWKSIYLEGLWAASEFISPPSPVLDQRWARIRPRLSATVVISYFKTYLQVCCECRPGTSWMHLWRKGAN